MVKAISNLEGYTRKIRGIQPARDEVLLYRGHPQTKFKLLPSLLRDPKLLEAEHTILRELVGSHPASFATDTSTLDQLVRVQHYSLPTRLLDATWNPLVALYFAAERDTRITGEVVVVREFSAIRQSDEHHAGTGRSMLASYYGVPQLPRNAPFS